MSQVDKKNPIPPFLSVDFLLFNSFSYLIKVKNNMMVCAEACAEGLSTETFASAVYTLHKVFVYTMELE